jgi:hypothetical protein
MGTRAKDKKTRRRKRVQYRPDRGWSWGLSLGAGAIPQKLMGAHQAPKSASNVGSMTIRVGHFAGASL